MKYLTSYLNDIMYRNGLYENSREEFLTEAIEEIMNDPNLNKSDKKTLLHSLMNKMVEGYR